MEIATPAASKPPTPSLTTRQAKRRPPCNRPLTPTPSTSPTDDQRSEDRHEPVDPVLLQKGRPTAPPSIPLQTTSEAKSATYRATQSSTRKGRPTATPSTSPANVKRSEDRPERGDRVLQQKRAPYRSPQYLTRRRRAKRSPPWTGRRRSGFWLSRKAATPAGVLEVHRGLEPP